MLHKPASVRALFTQPRYVLVPCLRQYLQLILATTKARPLAVADTASIIRAPCYLCALLAYWNSGTTRHEERAVETSASLHVMVDTTALTKSNPGFVRWMGIAFAELSPVPIHSVLKALLTIYTSLCLCRMIMTRIRVVVQQSRCESDNILFHPTCLSLLGALASLPCSHNLRIFVG
jgi:hypothetical protein